MEGGESKEGRARETRNYLKLTVDLNKVRLIFQFDAAEQSNFGTFDAACTLRRETFSISAARSCVIGAQICAAWSARCPSFRFASLAATAAR